MSLRPTGLFAEKATIHENIEIKKVQNQFETTEELIYHITHNTNNIVHKDGRIYLKINAKGELFAQSVSPFSKTFFDNIEPKIKDLVKAFIDKRYLTYSSCEGHDLSFRRYIGLAFANQESRQYIIEEITDLKLPGVEFDIKDSVSNCPIEFNDEGTYIYKNKIIPHKIDQQEIDSFNIQFHRKYEHYYFLEIVIFKAVPIFSGQKISLNFIKWICRNGLLIIAKKFLVESYTKKITNLIKSEKIKKYKY